jgi:6-pyruvoyltetrahydropterin/6-carboxytetrahydropterin synthase
MFEISKKFSIPVGHRLSQHKGKCKNIHGHNIDVIVTVETDELDHNGMVMDFSNLKKLVNDIVLDKFDHSLLLNATDKELFDTLKNKFNIENLILLAFEPTAENLCRFIYDLLENKLPINGRLKSVEIFENETSSAKYYR